MRKRGPFFLIHSTNKHRLRFRLTSINGERGKLEKLRQPLHGANNK